MAHGDNPQEQLQAMRSVDINLAPNAIPSATPDEIYHVDTQFDPDTQKEVVLWDDILHAFRHAVQVRNKTRVVQFLKGKDLRTLEPRRIAVIPNTILDVVVDNPLMDKGVATIEFQQLALQPVPSRNYDSMMKVETAFQSATPASSATSSPYTTSTARVPSTTTSTIRRDPVYGLVETAMENYNHIDRPLAFPSTRRPHAALDDQSPTIKNPAVPPHLVNSSNTQLQVRQQGPQIATANVPMERDVVQLSISASQGDKDAQVALGDMYMDGEGVAQDYQAAMDWYLKSAEQGYDVAQTCIGILYHKGQGVSQDYAQAMNWYLKAASQGNNTAQNNVGVLYRHGHSVPQDYAQAMEWYLRAANQGNAFAQGNIGYLYQHGLGVPQDHAQAIDWYLKAANQGDVAAQNNLLYLHQHGRRVSRDFIKVFK